jgi:hypothetical protein
VARPKCCCCGQLLPKPELFKPCSVAHVIYNFVASHPEGVTRQEIFDHLYGHRPSGGPTVGLNVINVHFVRVNDVLARKDRAIVGHRSGGRMRYTLRRLSTGNIWMPIA